MQTEKEKEKQQQKQIPEQIKKQNVTQSDKPQPTKSVNIATMVRIRPLLQSQKDFKQSIKYKDQCSLQINNSGQLRRQRLQKVFNHDTTQKQVFKSLQPIISKCSMGYNVTIFTYGQTGSGKTHTMFGSDWNNIVKIKKYQQNNINNNINNKFENNKSSQKVQKLQAQQTFLRSIQQDENHSGLIPRSIHYLFNELIIKRRKFIKVYCSFLQLYNENMLDLLEDDPKLAKQKKLFIHENQTDGIYIENLNQINVDNADECLELMKKGERNRVVRQTSMNIKSSRSHTIFQLLIEEIFPGKKTYRRMKLNLCDLAGSQKINKSQKMQNQHFQQLKNINLSLTTLGKVISALSENKKAPYRESKLSRLLQDSLGGNTYTVIIATITTKSICLDQSLNTLKFLQRAKQIKSSIITNQISANSPAQMKNLQKQIAYLKDILKLKRTGNSTIIDMDLSQKYKRLQQQNSKLKQLVDQEMVQKLKKQNVNLKIQLEKKKNDDFMEGLRRSGYTVNFNSQKGNINGNVLESQQKYRVKKEHRTIEQQGNKNSQYQGSQQQVNNYYNQPYQQIRSQYNNSIYQKNYIKNLQNSTKINNFETKSHTYNSSTDASRSNQQITKFSMFPSIGKRVSTNINNIKNSSANKILQRIQQIEKVKKINKLKLQKQLEGVGGGGNNNILSNFISQGQGLSNANGNVNGNGNVSMKKNNNSSNKQIILSMDGLARGSKYSSKYRY